MKSKVQKIPFMFCLFLAIFSCKKKEPIIEIARNSSDFRPTKINGILSITKYQIFNTPAIQTIDYSGGAFFSDTLITNNNINIYSSADYGNVYVNSSKLCKLQNLDSAHWFSYYDTTNSIYEGSVNWTINGSPNKPSFQATNYIEYPNYTWLTNILDTIDINKDLFLDFSALKEIDEIDVSLFSTSINTSIEAPHFLDLSTHTITYKSNELKELFYNNSNNSRMIIRIYKNKFKIINGLILNFRAITILEKNNFVIKQ